MIQRKTRKNYHLSMQQDSILSRTHMETHIDCVSYHCQLCDQIFRSKHSLSGRFRVHKHLINNTQMMIFNILSNGEATWQESMHPNISRGAGYHYLQHYNLSYCFLFATISVITQTYQYGITEENNIKIMISYSGQLHRSQFDSLIH